MKKLFMAYCTLRLGVDLVSRDVFFAGLPWLSRKNRLRIAGNHIYVGKECHFGADVSLGSYVLIASRVSFVGGDHEWKLVGVPIIRTGRETLKEVTVGDDVWIGHGATILHGVTLGEGCIIAAASVVTKNVPPYAIVAGNPARVIRNRFPDEAIEDHRRRLRDKWGVGNV
jgi:acetyltransferase-like isoleucine patch superfamily enzyme